MFSRFKLADGKPHHMESRIGELEATKHFDGVQWRRLLSTALAVGRGNVSTCMNLWSILRVHPDGSDPSFAFICTLGTRNISTNFKPKPRSQQNCREVRAGPSVFIRNVRTRLRTGQRPVTGRPNPSKIRKSGDHVADVVCVKRPSRGYNRG